MNATIDVNGIITEIQNFVSKTCDTLSVASQKQKISKSITPRKWMNTTTNQPVARELYQGSTLHMNGIWIVKSNSSVTRHLNTYIVFNIC